MMLTTLYIFSGLPSTGKSTIASRLAGHMMAAYVRIDTIEQGVRDLYEVDITYEGYQLAHAIASENLRAGVDVVSDSCNPLEFTRREWEKVATTSRARYINIETICSDITVHQHRVENRVPTVKNLILPGWTDVMNREYHPWTQPRLVIDTAGGTIEQCFADLLAKLKHSCRVLP